MGSSPIGGTKRYDTSIKRGMMSKTIKTRPLWVRMADSTDKAVGAVAVHNHIGRDCDLPDRTYRGISQQNHYGCHYEFAYNGVNVCGCKMCTSHYERKHENRVNRQVRHQMGRQIVKNVEVEENLSY